MRDDVSSTLFNFLCQKLSIEETSFIFILERPSLIAGIVSIYYLCCAHQSFSCTLIILFTIFCLFILLQLENMILQIAVFALIFYIIFMSQIQ
jgi:hypothetical protein